MKHERKLIVGLAGLAILVWLIYPQRPSETLPPSARNVKFSGDSGWQYWEYNLRFDADPEVCRSFAVQLMIKHGCETNRIFEEPFRGHIFDKRAPSWMKIDQFTNGVLISGGGDWIKAVVDLDRGRLYYRGFN